MTPNPTSVLDENGYGEEMTRWRCNDCGVVVEAVRPSIGCFGSGYSEVIPNRVAASLARLKVWDRVVAWFYDPQIPRARVVRARLRGDAAVSGGEASEG
jgi:hypothetical protein